MIPRGDISIVCLIDEDECEDAVEHVEECRAVFFVQVQDHFTVGFGVEHTWTEEMTG